MTTFTRKGAKSRSPRKKERSPTDKSSGDIKRKPRTETALSPQAADPLWTILDAKLGGREGMLEAALCSNNPKAADLAKMLLDPSQRKSGTKVLAKRCGLTAPEIVDMFRDRMWLETTLALHEDLPEIMKGAAVDAKPSLVPCADCKGIGVKEDIQCWVCSGTGKIRKSGDKDKLTFVGEAVGLTGKRGPSVQINQQTINQASPQISFEDLMKKATVNSGKKQIEGVVDAELVGDK